MSKVTTIIEHAERDAASGAQYYWAPFMMAGGISKWMENEISADAIGKSADAAICCFDYPLMLCIRYGYINVAAMDKIYGDLIKAGQNTSSGALSYWGYKLSVWQDWPGLGGGYWRPRKGDVVFFNAAVGGDLNHVVLACGSTDISKRAKVISFGERLEKPQQTTVNATTVEELKQAGHTAVKFTQPIWA